MPNKRVKKRTKRTTATVGGFRELETPTAAQQRAHDMDAKFMLYGGAAGGGKTSLLIQKVQMLSNERPGMAALVLRRTFKELSKAGAIMTRCLQEWRYDPGVHYDGESRRLTAPNKSTVEFGHMEHADDMHQYQGSEYDLICIDEGGTFLPEQLAYMGSRVRVKPGYTGQLVITANPGGPGHDYLYDNYVTNEDERYVFIPAKVQENPHINQGDYIEFLNELDDLERARLLHGDWNARLPGGFFDIDLWQSLRRGDSHYYGLERQPVLYVRSWDLAATAGRGDWSVCTLLAGTPGRLEVFSQTAYKYEASEVINLIGKAIEEDGPHIDTVIEQEPGSSGLLFVSMIQKEFPGYRIFGRAIQGNKQARARIVCKKMEEGKLFFIAGDYEEQLRREMNGFPHDSRIHDDRIDSLAQGCAHIEDNSLWMPSAL